jgi:ribonuclease P protein component
MAVRSSRRAAKRAVTASPSRETAGLRRVRTYQSLRRRSDFSRVQRRGKRQAGPLFVLLAADGRGPSRVGITVAKTVGNAVVRNRLRRRVKAILDRGPFGAPPYRDVVLIARPGAGEADFAAVAAELERLLR